MKLLLTNDDGIDARGIAVLHKSCLSAGISPDNIYIVAPGASRSGASHSITLRKKLVAKLRPLAILPGSEEQKVKGYGIDGASPADCVRLATHGSLLQRVLPEERRKRRRPPFDIVFSGCNRGGNVGYNQVYSGTVGAAREGAMCGLPAVAFSVALGKDMSEPNWELAERVCASVIRALIAPTTIGEPSHVPVPGAGYGMEGPDTPTQSFGVLGVPRPGEVLSVNIPSINQVKGFRSCRASRAFICDEFHRVDVEDDGAPGPGEFVMGDWYGFSDPLPDDDVTALREGYVALTMVGPDTSLGGDRKETLEERLSVLEL